MIGAWLWAHPYVPVVVFAAVLILEAVHRDVKARVARIQAEWDRHR